jgi:hypothetical protein
VRIEVPAQQRDPYLLHARPTSVRARSNRERRTCTPSGLCRKLNRFQFERGSLEANSLCLESNEIKPCSPMLRVDHARWGQTPEGLRQIATSAGHQRTRERFLALYEITQARCMIQVAARTAAPRRP